VTFGNVCPNRDGEVAQEAEVAVLATAHSEAKS
jgi:hypothetical protein